MLTDLTRVRRGCRNKAAAVFIFSSQLWRTLLIVDIEVKPNQPSSDDSVLFRLMSLFCCCCCWIALLGVMSAEDSQLVYLYFVSTTTSRLPLAERTWRDAKLAGGGFRLWPNESSLHFLFRLSIDPPFSLPKEVYREAWCGSKIPRHPLSFTAIGFGARQELCFPLRNRLSSRMAAEDRPSKGIYIPGEGRSIMRYPHQPTDLLTQKPPCGRLGARTALDIFPSSEAEAHHVMVHAQSRFNTCNVRASMPK